MRRGTASARPHEARGVAVINQHLRAVFLSKRSDLGQFGQVPVHREYAVRYDHQESRSGIARRLQLRLKIAHIRIRVTIALRLAQPDAVDQRSMVQRIAHNRIFGAQ